jgi:hypothetical protein
MGFISGIIRRLLGGLKTKFKILGERGFLIACLVLIYAPVIYFSHYHTYLEGLIPKWLFTIIVTALVIVSELKGHFPGFMCGTEDPAYIDEQLAKGRKIPYRRIVNWWGKVRGFDEFGEEWCFWQLILCKTVWTLPVVCFVGSQFWFAGLCTAFAYNAMFWVDMKPFKKILVSPTNWAEWFSGLIIGWSLI